MVDCLPSKEPEYLEYKVGLASGSGKEKGPVQGKKGFEELPVPRRSKTRQ